MGALLTNGRSEGGLGGPEDDYGLSPLVLCCLVPPLSPLLFGLVLALLWSHTTPVCSLSAGQYLPFLDPFWPLWIWLLHGFCRLTLVPEPEGWFYSTFFPLTVWRVISCSTSTEEVGLWLLSHCRFHQSSGLFLLANLRERGVWSSTPGCRNGMSLPPLL